MCLKKECALNLICIISVFGLLFSGYLSYTELFQDACALNGGCSTMFSVPVCVFGFIMYLAIFIICLIGIKNKEKPRRKR